MRLLLCALAFIASSASVQAQAFGRLATAADSLTIRKNVYADLMAGIVLTPQQRALAEEVIAAEDRAYWALPPNRTCDGQQERGGLIARRDSTLLAMMPSAADSALFNRHAAAYIMGPCPFPY